MLHTLQALPPTTQAPLLIGRGIAAAGVASILIVVFQGAGRLLLPLWLVEKMQANKASEKESGAFALVKEVLAVAKDAKELTDDKK